MSNTRYIPKAIRKEVLRRDGYKCRVCGSTEKPHLDHVKPYVDGGKSTTKNLQVLCQSCNTIKSSGNLHSLSYEVGYPITSICLHRIEDSGIWNFEYLSYPLHTITAMPEMGDRSGYMLISPTTNDFESYEHLIHQELHRTAWILQTPECAIVERTYLQFPEPYAVGMSYITYAKKISGFQTTAICYAANILGWNVYHGRNHPNYVKSS